MTESIRVAARARAPVAFGLVLLAAGGIFAVTMGARQSMGLFLSVINTTTGLGLASISLAFGVYLAHRVGVVDGLFTGQPNWEPR